MNQDDMQVLERFLPATRHLTQKIRLSPTQRKAAEGVLLGLKRGNFAVLQDMGSDGKTTVLGWVQEQAGGSLIGVPGVFSPHWLAVNRSLSKKRFSISSIGRLQSPAI